jgi:hypothetical protein
MTLFVTLWTEVSHLVVVTSDAERSCKARVAFGKLLDVLI